MLSCETSRLSANESAFGDNFTLHHGKTDTNVGIIIIFPHLPPSFVNSVEA